VTPILLIEDNPGDQVLMQEAFRPYPVNLHVAWSVDSARNMLAENIYSLVLLDYNLPRVAGADAVRLVKSLVPPTTPVIALSGSDHTLTIKAAYDAGANCYLVKPVGYQDLEDLIKALYEFWIVRVQRG